jgi:uncharacterized protein
VKIVPLTCYYMEKELNPFSSTTYIGPDYFCDRKQETTQLTQLMMRGMNVTLFAIRRLGKTGLIHHVFYPHRNSAKLACIYIDILATNNLSDFTNRLATAVYNRFPPQKSLGKKIMELFQRFRPVITFDELSGTPSLSLTIETQAQRENTLGQILGFLDRQNIRVVFAIDEFQQILEYPETNVEALLRTHLQQLKKTSFIFCGSNQKMMHDIFNSAKRPFFASCSNLNLGYIEEKTYKLFIQKKFTENKRTIDEECLNFICEWTKCHTFYTQYFCNTLFAQNKKQNRIENAREVALSILKLNESTFYQYKNLLTEAQWRLLRAIAKEEKLFQPQAKRFISQHHLDTPAMVKRGLDALLNKEIVLYNSGVERPYYEVYDKFLMRWLQYD